MRTSTPESRSLAAATRPPARRAARAPGAPREREWDDDAVVAVSVVGWLLTLLVAIAFVVGLVLFFATSGFWGGGGDPPF